MNVLIVGARGAGKTTLIRRSWSLWTVRYGDLRQKKKEIRSIFMMRGRSMCHRGESGGPVRRDPWVSGEGGI